jgi:hypothetical protein
METVYTRAGSADLDWYQDGKSQGGSNMHAVVRNYSGAGAKQLIDLLEQRKADVEAVIRKVPGLMSYTLLRSGDGGVSVTVCKDKAGADESLKVARDWIQKNASNTRASPPAVMEGSVIIQIK